MCLKEVIKVWNRLGARRSWKWPKINIANKRWFWLSGWSIVSFRVLVNQLPKPGWGSSSLRRGAFVVWLWQKGLSFGWPLDALTASHLTTVARWNEVLLKQNLNLRFSSYKLMVRVHLFMRVIAFKISTLKSLTHQHPSSILSACWEKYLSFC